MTHGPKLIDRKPETLVLAPAWAVWLYRLRWVPLLLAAALGAAVWPAASRVGVDSSNEAFIMRDNFSWYEFGRFTRAFGAEESIAVGIHLHKPLDAESAVFLTELQEELQKIPGVAAVHGLGGLTQHRLKWFGQIEEKPLFENLLSGKEAPAVFLARRSAWPPPAQQLLSQDGQTAALIVTLKDEKAAELEGADPAAPIDAVAVLEEVRRVVDRSLPAGTESALTGTVLEQHAFGSQIDRDRRAFVPLCIAVIVVLLLVFHLDLRTLIYSLAVMGGSLAITQSLMAYLGTRVHAVTALLAPVILIVAVSSTIKACGIFDLVRGTPQPSLRLAQALRGMFAPCSLANLTTFIGFLALLVSRVQAVRDFGFYGAVGTASAWALTMLGAPVFAVWKRSRHGARLDFFEKIGYGVAWITRYTAWLLVAAAVAFTVVAARQIPKIHTSTDLLKIFQADDPFRRDTESFIARLGGIYPLEVMVEAPSLAGMRTPETWDRLDLFQKKLAESGIVSNVSGPTDVVRYFETVSDRPRNPKILGKILDEIPQKNPEGWRHFATEGNLKLRFTAFLTTSDTTRVMELSRTVPAIARDTLGADWDVTVTGETRLLAEMSEQLVHDEAASVLTAFGVILVLIVFMVRSLPYALLAIVPNFLPIAGLFGAMAVLGIGLNTATAMIASVAIGLVFDNTVYLLYGYREARALGMDADAAVTHTMSRRFRPVIASSLILAGGFGVTMFGHMIPTVQFGFLSCVTIGLVTVSDLFVLPSLLRIFKPR